MVYCRWDEDEDVSWHGWFSLIDQNLCWLLSKKYTHLQKHLRLRRHVLCDIFFSFFFLTSFFLLSYDRRSCHVILRWGWVILAVKPSHGLETRYIYLNIYSKIYSSRNPPDHSLGVLVQGRPAVFSFYHFLFFPFPYFFFHFFSVD